MEIKAGLRHNRTEFVNPICTKPFSEGIYLYREQKKLIISNSVKFCWSNLMDLYIIFNVKQLESMENLNMF